MDNLFGIGSTPYSVQRKKYKGSKECDAGFFYSPSNGKGGDDTQSEFLGKFISNTRITVLLLITLIGITILFGKAFYLQVISNNYYAGLAEGNRVRHTPIQSVRGIIYDKDGDPLVENRPTFDVSLIPADLPTNSEDRSVSINKISALINVPVENVVQ